MVTLRRSSRQAGHVSSPATKSTNPGRTTANRNIQVTEPPIPVMISVNPSPPVVLLSSFEMPHQNPRSSSQATFDFDGIQYSPYFLTSGDNPGTSIISEVLDGSNYNTWNLSITIALDAKNKIGFVDGSLSRPSETHPHYRIWSSCNSMVKSWILNSVKKKIYGSMLRFNDASEIWKDLMARFRITNLPRSYQLTQQNLVSPTRIHIFI